MCWFIAAFCAKGEQEGEKGEKERENHYQIVNILTCSMAAPATLPWASCLPAMRSSCLACFMVVRSHHDFQFRSKKKKKKKIEKLKN